MHALGGIGIEGDKAAVRNGYAADFQYRAVGPLALEVVCLETARKFGYENLRFGLIVTSIKDGSPADEVGLEVGDVLESAAGIQLGSVNQLAAIFEEAKKQGQPLRVIVRRGNKRMILPLLVQ